MVPGRGRSAGLLLHSGPFLPLDPAEFLALAERVQEQPLEEARLTLDWVEQTDSLLVGSPGGNRLSPELLELYFESRRSGGGPVRTVRLLQGGAMAVVSFHDRAGERTRQGALWLHPRQPLKKKRAATPGSTSLPCHRGCEAAGCCRTWAA